ncbi:flagellar basal body-associated FliL family protein [Deferribacterales bacterium RsTz2092]
MAKDEEKEEGQEEPKKKKSPILLITILLVALAGAGIAVKMFVLKPSGDGATAGGDGGAVAHQVAPSVVAEPGPMQAYPPFLVNLADPGGQRYLKASIALELSKEPGFPAEITVKEARIKDVIISVLSGKTSDEVASMQGKVALRQEILRRLNTIMAGGRVTDVFITEFVMQ